MNISGFTSSSALAEQARQSVLRLQQQLTDAQGELSSGRVGDIGLKLGADVRKSLNYRLASGASQAMLDANKTVSTHLEASQSALKTVVEGAQALISTLVTAKTDKGTAKIAANDAREQLKAFISSMNTTVDGEYIFGGINSGARVLPDYFATPAPSSKQAIDAAFLAKFGVNQQDPAVSNISGADMSSFLSNEFENQFQGANWTANWSSASDTNIKSRINRDELTETSQNANAAPLKKIAEAFVLVSETGLEASGDDARTAIVDKALKLLGEGVSGVAGLQSNLGIAQERVKSANDVLSIQKNMMSGALDAIEGVDAAEVSTRITSLLNQIEISYSLTSKLNSLSLLKYL